MINRKDREALQRWEEMLEQIRNATPVDYSETPAEKKARMDWLEKPGNHEEWFKYYFPKYCKSEAAEFHKKSTRKFLKAEKIYQCRAWCRGMSKSTRRMFEVFYLTLVRKFPTYMLLCSHSYDQAELLLEPYMLNFEGNQRIIADYGVQQKYGKWANGWFTTKTGATFRAVGAGQTPRGARNEDIRANILDFDDIDNDEVCLNEERLDKTWKWIERAVIPTVDIAAPYYICFDNNIIAEDSLAKRAQSYATDVSIVNIRDENGVSSWPEKNSEEDIQAIENSISYESFQTEYMNNPMSQGKTFKEIYWGKCPPLSALSFALVYADPATSNKDKPSIKSKANNSAKPVGVLGFKDNKFYIYTAWVDNISNAKFIEFFYAARDYIGNKTASYYYVENNTLQDPFYQQVLLPLIHQRGMNDPNGVLPLSPDDRKKPEKWTRIEATLEPLNRLGQLIFNEKEKGNPHMERLAKQFLNAKPNSKNLDGLDMVEGGVHLIKEKISIEAVGGIETFARHTNTKRF